MKKSFKIEIKYSWCKRCGLCYWICPTKVIVQGELMFPKVENEDRCIGCLQCENICPDLAITVKEVKEEIKSEV